MADMRPYENIELSFEDRAKDLVSRMTLDEKVSQIRSGAKAIPQFDIPKYAWWAECLHGVTRPRDTHRATCFPQGMAMAASWNPVLMQRVGDAISDEARARHHHQNANGLTFYTPNINILRDPRWGRGLETYGEDPYLTSRMGVAFIKGLQGDHPRYLKIAATAKHFAVHSGPEQIRRHFDAIATERDMRETYFPAFKAAIQEGEAAMLMTAYNKLNGVPCTADPWLLKDLLRDEWGFDGLVTSDDQSASDVAGYHRYAKSQKHGGALVLKNGCDMELGTKAFADLADAVKQGLVSEGRLDEACRRAMVVRMRLGMFDPPANVPFTSIPLEVVGGKPSRDAALQMARESMVLLKNSEGLLPLDAKALKRIAVIGPNSDDAHTLTSTYFWGKPTALVTPLTGIRNLVGDDAEVVYHRGCDWEQSSIEPETVPSMALLPVTDQENRRGLEAEYYNSIDLSGEPVLRRLDQDIDFNWKDASPHATIAQDSFSVRWRGRLVPTETGAHMLSLNVDDGVRLWLDGELLIDCWEVGKRPVQASKSVWLEKGETYPITIEYFEQSGGASIQLQWVVPQTSNETREAAELASRCDVAILCLGAISKHGGGSMEGEWRDRSGIDLPDVQEKLLRAVAKTGTPTILVLMNGGPISAVWADEHIPAIVEAWYPGQEGGTALAEVLFGQYNPGGRMPCTVYRSEADLPPATDYAMRGRTYRFFEGTPLYAFGHGLSYSTFEYSTLAVEGDSFNQDAVVRATVTVSNTSGVAGDEVVQVYIRQVGRADDSPVRQLKAFRRIGFSAGESKQVTFELPVKEWGRWDTPTGKWVVDPGTYTLELGRASDKIEAQQNITVR